MTTFAEKLTNRVNKIKNMIAPSDIIHERLAICKQCEFYIELTGQCKKCGCFLKGKTMLSASECPIKKWLAVNVSAKVE
jgi:hypothetical protein